MLGGQGINSCFSDVGRRWSNEPGEAKASSSFLKKRTKKLLSPGARCRRFRDSRTKSFLLLFSKKQALLSVSTDPPNLRLCRT